MVGIGSAFAIGVVKMAFGGLGYNIVNPALGGRIFLMACFPSAMTAFCAPLQGSMNGLPQGIDGISMATPLTALKSTSQVEPLIFADALGNMFWGFTGGCIGETSSIALLIGAGILWYKRIIGFGVPLGYLGTVFVCAFFFSGLDGQFTSEALIIATYHVLGGGLLLGAFFMASDMVTSPITPFGRVVFGVGCGVLTFLIRKYGGYPEGVSYAIVLMNLVSPLCDRLLQPRTFGKK
jgi:electron transport complex protein RnfD